MSVDCKNLPSIVQKKVKDFWKEIAFLDILVKMAELKMWLIHIHKIVLQQRQDI